MIWETLRIARMKEARSHLVIAILQAICSLSVYFF